MRGLLAALALIAALGPMPASAQATLGTSGAQFLKLGAGARAGAMGEAQLALADDVYAVYYNPAGLVDSDKPMAAGMHDAYFQGISYDFVAFSLPFGEADHRQALAASIYGISASNIDRRTQDTDLPIGSFDTSEAAYALSYAYRASPELSLGATGKYITSRLDVVSASAFGLDAGLKYKLGLDSIGYHRPVDLAFVVRDAGSSIDFADGSDPLPLTLGIGAATELTKGFKLEVDAMKARDTNVWVQAGGEYSLVIAKGTSGALRAGYSTHDNQIDGITGVTAGCGLILGPVALDFAWIPFGDLGNTFRYSLAVKF